MEIKYVNRKTGKIEIERPPGIGWLKFLYDNPFGKKTVLPLAKRKLLTYQYGKKMDRASSIKKIKPFVDKFEINLNEAKKSMSEFTSFNDFFYRELKDNARPIDEGLVSPGDGRMLAFENVNEVNEFYVKGKSFTLNEFLLNDELANQFKNDALIILRLSPEDYHRFHFPFNGVPADTTRINGKYYSVSPIALARNFGRVFTENKREYAILNTENHGEILIAPVGATMVGSIVETYQPDSKVQKGQEMGYFKFGGSTIVLLVDSSKFRIDHDIIENTKNKLETLVQMGERIAKAL